MFDSISRSKERKLRGSIQKPFQKPLPPESKDYPYDRPISHSSLLSFLYSLLNEFFTLFGVALYFNAPHLFRALRQQWNIDESSYRSSFQQPLITLSGPLGFFGASFFTTADKKYIIKSLDRKFEWHYFYKDLLLPLAKYQLSHPDSKIGHITDALFNFAPRLGQILGTSCSNWLIMENAKVGDGWEDYDLKPTNYFYPERDFLGGKITSEKTKDKLFDEFEGRIRLHRAEYEVLVQQLDEDSQFLCEHKAIDYSLFVLRRRYKQGRFGHLCC
jgi:Phosphatidylinositol-4-phosphate 5-Kinase